MNDNTAVEVDLDAIAAHPGVEDVFDARGAIIIHTTTQAAALSLIMEYGPITDVELQHSPAEDELPEYWWVALFKYHRDPKRIAQSRCGIAAAMWLASKWTAEQADAYTFHGAIPRDGLERVRLIRSMDAN